MAMTEKQGGSDVRANTTTRDAAERRRAGRRVLLRGHKWFCSAPMCDLFLVLAQADERPVVLPVPRILPDGTRNVFRLQRLKDKLGNRSNASSEVEFDGTWARLVGEPGPRRAHDHRDGQPHPAGLRGRLGRRHARGPSARPPGTPPTAAPSAACWPTSR